jgi:hypothetical protein
MCTVIVAICCRKTGTVVIISSFGSCSSPRRCGLRQLRRLVLRFKTDPSLFLVSPRRALQRFGARTRLRVVPRLLKFAGRPVRTPMFKSGYRSVTQLERRPTTRGAPNLCDPTKKAELHLNLSSSWKRLRERLYNQLKKIICATEHIEYMRKFPKYTSHTRLHSRCIKTGTMNHGEMNGVLPGSKSHEEF